jgi:hypothetical protein
MKLTFDEFCKEAQGRTFADVIARAPAALREVLAILSDSDCQRRMEESEPHHMRPALAGVVVAIEARSEVAKIMKSADKNFAKRFRQATGAAARIVMEGRGWKKTGRKGAVGVGDYFNRAEHYVRP